MVARYGRLAGRPTPIRASVRNNGAEPAVLTCTLTDDSGGRAVRALTVPAHGQSEIGLSAPPAAAGTHWARLRLEGSATPLLGDGCIAYHCGERRAILLVGARRPLGLLPLALAPGSDGSLSGLEPHWTDLGALAASLQQGCAFAVLTWQDLQLLDALGMHALQAWIEAGGRLLAVPDAQLAPALCALPMWLDCAGEPIRSQGADESGLVALDPRAELLHDLVDADGAVRFPRCGCTRPWPCMERRPGAQCWGWMMAGRCS